VRMRSFPVVNLYRLPGIDIHATAGKGDVVGFAATGRLKFL